MYHHAVGAGNEARVLREADTLDFLGWEGVTRLLSIASRNDVATSIGMIRKYITDLPPTLSTAAGREMAVPRVAAMRVFLDGLDGELKGIGAP
jgi:hypothetical protein